MAGPATFEFDEWNLVGKVQAHAIANFNFGAVDDHELVITVEANKIARGSNSYIKYITGHFSGSYELVGPNGKCWLSTKSLPTGVTMKAGVTVTYATPVTTASGDSDIPESEGAALAIKFGDTPEAASNDSEATIPCYTQYIRLQLQTSAGSPTGAIGTNTLTLKYDES